jgi:hypothetical protein
LVPAGFPFTNHANEGLLPPLTGVAVYVTGIPAQAISGFGEIVTETGSELLTNIVIVFEIAGFVVVHVMSEVRLHVTASPFNGMYEKVGVFAPLFIPFTFH